MTTKRSKIYWGMSGLSHDASLAVVRYHPLGQDLVYASHAERYSRVKNEPRIQAAQVEEAWQFGAPDAVFWFENPLLKRLRFLRTGMWSEAFSKDNNPIRMIRDLGIDCPVHMGNHHHSHAAAAYFTRPSGWGSSSSVDVLVADAIGEFETLTAWQGKGQYIRQVGYPLRYPESIGLFYTAVTQHVGLKPNEEEFILMGMAAYGEVVPGLARMFQDLINNGANFHRGLLASGINPHALVELKDEDIAATAQHVVEVKMVQIAKALRLKTGSKYLCLAGGVALNCVANTKIANIAGYDDVWIMPNPGDAGSALGAVLAHTKECVSFEHAFLGTNIRARACNGEIVNELLNKGIVGVARGCAEWGPRALGNRSLLADPRHIDIQDRVNTIKQRQKFRPFAPMVLDDHAHTYFDLPDVDRLDFMQYAVRCKRPKEIPAVVHADGTSRIQLVGPNHPCRELLEVWFQVTGCPVLLNTSLNIKGEPLVNDLMDAMRFETRHKIRVLS